MKKKIEPTETMLGRFVAESNAIEGIMHVLPHEVTALKRLVDSESVTRADVTEFVAACQPDAVLRDRVGLNVRVGSYVAPPGGHFIVGSLALWLQSLDNFTDRHITPFSLYVSYERLHPFTDGNGRSGRALWLWRMLRESGRLADQALALGFLQCFHYQSLESFDKVVQEAGK
jgi:hypothetical protein